MNSITDDVRDSLLVLSLTYNKLSSAISQNLFLDQCMETQVNGIPYTMTLLTLTCDETILVSR
jgi:hypothetical protein